MKATNPIVVVLCAVVVAAATATAFPTLGRIQLEPGLTGHEAPEWSMVKAAPAVATPITLTLALHQSNTDKLEELLLDVSDPDRVTTYGKHLSFEEVNRLVAPAEATVATVLAWLKQHDIQQDAIAIQTTVGVAEAMLGTKYAWYRHASTKQAPILRLAVGASYSVPAALQGHLEFVAPTTQFPHVRALNVETPNNLTLFVTPSFLRALYQTDGAVGKAGSGNVQAVVSFIQQYWSASDLKEFFGLLSPTQVNQTVAKQIGDNDPTNPGPEASLDVQYLMAMGENIETWVWYTSDQNTPFMSFLMNVSSTAVVPNLFSASYGEYENSLSATYANRVNVEFQKLGLRGVSMLVASGDDGAGGNCTNAGDLSPDFPASSPWVTTVGGVEGGDSGHTPTGEYADYISGGGFSNFFPAPSYQQAAIAKYLTNTTGLPPTGSYNKSGRGYPDIAAQSEGFFIVVEGIPIAPVGGTSCATPTSGGIFSLLNDLRLAAGKPALGFLNPFIYKASATLNAFNDITFGGDEGCTSLVGFVARPGWDAVTGVGSPNYRLLSALVEALP